MREPCVRVSASSYSKVGAIEQRYMVNSGVRGTKNKGLRAEVGCASIAPIIYHLPCHAQAPSTGNLCCWCSRRLRRFGLAAGAPSGLGPLRTRAGSTVHYTIQSRHSALCCARAAEGGAGEKEGRGNGGRGEGSRSDSWWQGSRSLGDRGVDAFPALPTGMPS